MIRDMIARFVWGQFRKPSGLLGWSIGNGMAASRARKPKSDLPSKSLHIIQ